MNDWYSTLADQIKAAGYCTNGIENCGTFERTTICSTKLPNGALTGNSFWVTKLGNRWFLGTWGVRLYRLQESGSIADVCIDWLNRVPRPTMADFDEQLKSDHALEEISDDEFESATRRIAGR